MGRAYITLLGRSVWASLNTYYSAVNRGYYPDTVWLVTEKRYEEYFTLLDEGIRVISTGFDFEPVIRSIVLEEGNIVEAGTEVRGLIESLRPEYKVALDITSARKALVAGTLLATTDCKPDHIYYLMLDSLDARALRRAQFYTLVTSGSMVTEGALPIGWSKKRPGKMSTS